MSKINSSIFRDFNDELTKIFEKEYIHTSKWKEKVSKYIEGSYKIKLERLDIDRNYDMSDNLDTNIARAVLRDMYYKYSNYKQTKDNIEIAKLLKARESNIDFEIELAQMITGDNQNFPYRSSSFLTEFFYNLGHNRTHNGATRKEWVRDILLVFNIKEIYILLSSPNGLFKKKYFKKHTDELDIDFDDFYLQAKKEFENFIKNSIEVNQSFDLSSVLDMNVNMELLFETKADSNDEELNILIEDAKERFLSNDRQVGVEKLWDAFERLKTFFSEKDKKESATKIVKVISKEFDFELINEEFKKLSKIGNNYRIRHHETGKSKLTPKHQKYFFFRMLSLIDLCLTFLNSYKKI
jgi:hypothetical protein